MSGISLESDKEEEQKDGDDETTRTEGTGSPSPPEAAPESPLGFDDEFDDEELDADSFREAETMFEEYENRQSAGMSGDDYAQSDNDEDTLTILDTVQSVPSQEYRSRESAPVAEPEQPMPPEPPEPIAAQTPPAEQAPEPVQPPTEKPQADEADYIPEPPPEPEPVSEPVAETPEEPASEEPVETKAPAGTEEYVPVPPPAPPPSPQETQEEYVPVPPPDPLVSAAPPPPEPATADTIFDETMLGALKDSLGKKQLTDLLESLIEKADEIIAVLSDISVAGNIDEISARAHELKGMAGNFGLTELSTLAAELERNAKAGITDGIPGILEALPDANRRAKSALAKWINT